MGCFNTLAGMYGSYVDTPFLLLGAFEEVALEEYKSIHYHIREDSRESNQCTVQTLRMQCMGLHIQLRYPKSTYQVQYSPSEKRHVTGFVLKYDMFIGSAQPPA